MNEQLRARIDNDFTYHLFDGDRDEDRMAGPRMLTWLFGALALALAAWIGLGACAGSALADHRACNPGPLSFPRTWSIQPGVDPGPWQIAQRLTNLSNPGRDWIKWVPWGTPSSYYVIAGSGPGMWVQMDCAARASIIHVYGTPTHIGYWAAHETMHAAFFVGDHIRSSQYPAPGYMNPEYCDAPRESITPYEYRGGMSYCEGPGTLFTNFPAPYFDDFDMMRTLFP